jgi:hypothetical protein
MGQRRHPSPRRSMKFSLPPGREFSSDRARQRLLRRSHHQKPRRLGRRQSRSLSLSKPHNPRPPRPPLCPSRRPWARARRPFRNARRLRPSRGLTRPKPPSCRKPRQTDLRHPPAGRHRQGRSKCLLSAHCRRAGPQPRGQRQARKPRRPSRKSRRGQERAPPGCHCRIAMIPTCRPSALPRRRLGRFPDRVPWLQTRAPVQNPAPHPSPGLASAEHPSRARGRSSKQFRAGCGPRPL